MAPSHQAHRLREITVVAHHDRAIVGVQPAVVQEMYCKIDVRPLFFGLDHLRRPRVSNRARQRHSNTVAQEVPEVDFHLGPIVLKRPKIDVLTLRLRGIGGRARHSRREILDPQDIVMRLQHLREQRRQVKPFPRRSLERSVVQIEPVYVNVRIASRYKSRGLRRAPRPAVETARGVSVNLGALEAAIKPAVAVAPSGEASVPTSSIVTSDSMFLAPNPRLVSPA